MLVCHERNKILFNPLVIKEVVKQHLIGTEFYLYNLKLIIWDNFYSGVCNKLVREFSSTLTLIANV